MAGKITLALGFHDLPDGTRKVKLMLFAGEDLQIFFFMSPDEAEATGKAMRDIAIQVRTKLVVPQSGLVDA